MMKAPKHLSHKPIVEAADYHLYDGMYADQVEKEEGAQEKKEEAKEKEEGKKKKLTEEKKGTDAMALSLGLAQWNLKDLNELSVKVWRKPNDAWSQQSEELPPHRALDLAYLVARVYDDVRSHAVKNYEDDKVLPSATDFTICVADADKKKHLENYFKEHEDIIRRRLKALKDQLNAMPGI